MVDLSLVSTGLGIISSILFVGWTVSNRIGKLETALAEIRILLQATVTRIEHIEHDIEKLEEDVADLKQKTKG